MRLPLGGENADAGEKGAQSLQIRDIAGVHHVATNRRDCHHESIYRAGLRHRGQGFTGQNCCPVRERFNVNRIDDRLPQFRPPAPPFPQHGRGNGDRSMPFSRSPIYLPCPLLTPFQRNQHAGIESQSLAAHAGFRPRFFFAAYFRARRQPSSSSASILSLSSFVRSEPPYQPQAFSNAA